MKIFLTLFILGSLSAQAARECTENKLFCFTDIVIDLNTSTYMHRAAVVGINSDDTVNIQATIDGKVQVVKRQQSDLAITQDGYCLAGICVGGKVAMVKSAGKDLEDEEIYSSVVGITPAGTYVLVSDIFPLEDAPIDTWIFTYSKRQDLVP